jgi:hypothetical protein
VTANDDPMPARLDLDAMRQRCEKATTGPWKSYVEGRDHDSGSSFIMTSGTDIELLGATIADQDFIAHARQDIPQLIGEIERRPLTLTIEQLTRWADSCLHINHLNTLVQREIAANSTARASELAERARRGAWQMLNEMFAAGAKKPDGYCEPEGAPANGDSPI